MRGEEVGRGLDMVDVTRFRAPVAAFWLLWTSGLGRQEDPSFYWLVIEVVELEDREMVPSTLRILGLDSIT
jgi:hypothetical protein